MLSKKSKPMIGILDMGSVGLGILAALEKNSDFPANRTLLFNRKLSRTSSVPIKNNDASSVEMEMEMEMESFEEYTIVTCHGPNESYTKVYGNGIKGDDRRVTKETVFHISPASFVETDVLPSSSFLSKCDLCEKKLHDKDIYMYRGEKAFCSAECRYTQMLTDERKEQNCSKEASSIRSVVEVANSPYSNDGQILTTGILAL